MHLDTCNPTCTCFQTVLYIFGLDTQIDPPRPQLEQFRLYSESNICPLQPATVLLLLQGVALGGVPSLHRSRSAARSVVSHRLGGLPQWHVLRGLPRRKKGCVPLVLLWRTGVRLKGKEGCRQPAWPRYSPIVPSGVPSPPPSLTVYCSAVRSLKLAPLLPGVTPASQRIWAGWD